MNSKICISSVLALVNQEIAPSNVIFNGQRLDHNHYAKCVIAFMH